MSGWRWRVILRILVTVAAWIVSITYAHKLGHLYLDDLKAAFSTPASDVVAQVIVISVLICGIWISLPLLPKMTKRKIGAVVFWATLLAAGHHLSHFGFHQFRGFLGETSSDPNMGMLIVFSCIYLFVLAIPFVPGVELGLLIMVLFGATGALVAYLATVGGIVLAFAAGRLLPISTTSGWLDRIGLSNLALNPDAAIEKMFSEKQSLASWLGSKLLNYRHIALALCLNLPGNSMLGGGGGIGLLCGLGRTFSWKGFVGTVVPAVSPVPILAVFGVLQLEALLEKHGLLHEVLRFLESFLVHQ